MSEEVQKTAHTQQFNEMECTLPSFGDSYSSQYVPEAQFNASGGNQNINTGHGYQFPGASFGGSVNINQNYGTPSDTSSLIHSCLRSLEFMEMKSRLNGIVREQKGTCMWLLEHEKYKDWTYCQRSLLWIKGNPGSGKSTLMRYALKNISHAVDEGATPIILFFFFHDRGTKLQKTPLGLYRSLLHQLLTQAPTVMQGLVVEFQENHNTPWELSQLQEIFESTLPKVLGSHSVWLFVDALDECDKDYVADLVNNFKCLIESHLPSSTKQLHICISCRHYPNLDPGNALQICLEDENENDISIYVHTQLSKYATDEPSILAAITSRASGIFMWVKFAVDFVERRSHDGIPFPNLVTEVDSIPPNLDDLYKGLIQSMDEKADSLRLIRWICFALQALEVHM